MRITKPSQARVHIKLGAGLQRTLKTNCFPYIIDFTVSLSSALLSSWKEKFQIFWPTGDLSLSDFRATLQVWAVYDE